MGVLLQKKWQEHLFVSDKVREAVVEIFPCNLTNLT